MSFMNKELYARQLANYCDYLMKIDIKGNNDELIESKLDNILNLFRCLSNKLLFQIDYTVKTKIKIEKTV